MVLRKVFPNTFKAPDSAPAKTRNASIYLMRGIYYMGVQTPPEQYFWTYCLFSVVLNLCTTIYQPLGFIMGYVSHLSDLSPGEFLSSVQVAMSCIACSIKLIIVWVLVKRFEIANKIFDEMDKRLVKPSDRRDVHSAVSRSNRTFLFYMGVYMTYATLTFIFTVANGRPPYQNYYPGLDWRASPKQFMMQSILEYFSIMIACFQNALVDFYPMNFIMPLRAHLASFADRLRQLGSNPEESAEERYEKLIECIQDHKTILRFCDNLRPMISSTIFVQLLVVGLVLGLTIVNLLMFANLGARIAALIFLAAVLLETTPFCILCNYLLDDCLKLSDALFASNWFEQDKRYQKTCQQFLQNLQKPIIFMAGNLMTISVATNISATKFSFSVYTLVKQMHIAEKLTKGYEN